MTLRKLAPIKVNLCLHVGPVRADGFHELASLAVFPNAGDEMRAERSGTLSLDISGPFAGQLAELPVEDNLVMKAVRMFAAEMDEKNGVKLTLVKNVPAASGIGGGTADAAATLVLLRDLWQREISDERLFQLAGRLGADGPVCLAPHLFGSPTAIMTGAGERVLRGPELPSVWICLVNPLQQISTGRIFAAFDKQNPEPELPYLPRFKDIADFVQNTKNDLQPYAEAACPKIVTVLSRLASTGGNIMARMSGSGATCFGLFNNEEDAHRAKAQAEENKWWGLVARL